MKNRLKNKGLWLSLAALLFLVLQDFGVILDPEKYGMYVNLITTIGYCLLGVGIYNNPDTENTWYKDDNDRSQG
ncbi:holin [Romboutsia ilealis]|uniref:holin n=1 Tax=Romboutsia ilealis TaxID=1115758 RepID=UPI00272A43FE|nr:holin [Romboutsia ilealis]